MADSPGRSSLVVVHQVLIVTAIGACTVFATWQALVGGSAGLAALSGAAAAGFALYLAWFLREVRDLGDDSG